MKGNLYVGEQTRHRIEFTAEGAEFAERKHKTPIFCSTMFRSE